MTNQYFEILARLYVAAAATGSGTASTRAGGTGYRGRFTTAAF